jgi:translation initiation factor 1 (eIF-1/SUI1)
MVMQKVKQILERCGFSENLIEHVIEEKLKRYEELKEKIKNGKIKESAMVIAEITRLEDSIVKAIETYLKLRYPEKYSTRVVREEGLNIDDEELKKVIEDLRKYFGLHCK